MKDTDYREQSAGGFETDDTEDFATLFEASQTASRGSAADQNKIVADIVSIGDEWLFLDIGGKTEGIISRDEFVNDQGALTVTKGDTITAYIIKKSDGEVLLSRKMTMAASSEAAREAFHRGIPVEGLVMEERKGGFSVKLFGNLAFCPYSQIDLSSARPAQDYIGQKFSFRITEYSDRGKNIVLSRRRVLEEERLERIQELQGILKVDDVLTGTVKRIESFGAFVDIGGIEGLVPISEISWARVGDISEFLVVGLQIPVKIISLDWDRNRISLSVKQATQDPWTTVESKYSVGSNVHGIVQRLTAFGVFLELEPGIEGLIHISNLGKGRRINHPREVVSPGMALDARIISIDPFAKRIGLEIEKQSPETDELQSVELRQGMIITGSVDSIQDYGVFVKLPGGSTGLLHVSEIDGPKSTDLKKRFPLGANIDCQILSIDESSDRISLSLKSMDLLQEKQQIEDFRSKGVAHKPFGTLGDILRDKLQKK